MKKLAYLFVLVSFIGLTGVATVHASAAPDSDLAVGDPLSKGYHRTTKKHVAKKPADTATDATKSAPAEKAPPAEGTK